MSDARVVVGFDSVSDRDLANTAVALAQLLEAELFGVFVERMDAERFARLPFAALVEESGRLKTLDPAALGSLLRAAASVAEGELSGAARRGRVASSFGVARGRFLGALRAAAREQDLVVVPSARSPSRSPPKGPVSVALPDAERAPGLLDLAHRVARHGEPLIALATEDPALREALREFVGEHARRVVVQRLAALEPAALGRALARSPARLVVLTAESDVLDELRRTLACPLLIVP